MTASVPSFSTPATATTCRASACYVCLITDDMDATTTAEACVFSARDNGWIRWTVSSDVYTDVTNMDMDQRFVGRAGGSIFFSGIENGHVLLALDEATGGFSTITLPLALDDVYNLYVTGRICESSMGTQEP